MSKNNSTEIISVNVPTTESTEKRNNTVISTSNNDVVDILSKIRQHLARLKFSSSIDFNKNLDDDKILTVGEYKISRECLLHFLAGNPEFLKDSANQCSAAIQNFSNEAGNLDLSALINLSPNKSFIRDSEFYKNLYGFNISIADFIANNDQFKNTNFNTQTRILSNYQEFLRQSIDYLGKYMQTYQVVDDNLITSSYNLMYLLNSITFRRANMGKNIYELQSIYTALVDAIMQNISIYNSIDSKQIINQPVTKNDVLDEGISKLAEELKQRLNLLKKQQVTLINNVKEINADSNNLRNYVNGDVVNIVDSLKSQIANLSSQKISDFNTDQINNLNTDAIENIKTVEEYNPIKKTSPKKK
nr:hypothetical protein [Megavirus caiporensis]